VPGLIPAIKAKHFFWRAECQGGSLGEMLEEMREKEQRESTEDRR